MDLRTLADWLIKAAASWSVAGVRRCDRLRRRGEANSRFQVQPARNGSGMGSRYANVVDGGCALDRRARGRIPRKRQPTRDRSVPRDRWNAEATRAGHRRVPRTESACEWAMFRECEDRSRRRGSAMPSINGRARSIAQSSESQIRGPDTNDRGRVEVEAAFPYKGLKPTLARGEKWPCTRAGVFSAAAKLHRDPRIFSAQLFPGSRCFGRRAFPG